MSNLKRGQGDVKKYPATQHTKRNGSAQAATELLKPAAEDRLHMGPVPRRVNKTGTLLDEVAA
jgi:hypothetical protein